MILIILFNVFTSLIPTVYFQEKYFPSAFSKFGRVQNRRLWEKTTYNSLDNVVSEIEFRLGRLCPMVTDNGEKFMKDKTFYVKAAETADHLRLQLNFLLLAY